MAKLPEDRGTPEQYEETVHPENPPRSSVLPAAGVVGMWYYLGPIGILILALVLWFTFGGSARQDESVPATAPTTGQETPMDRDTSGVWRPDDTQEELERRGVEEDDQLSR